MDPKRLFLFSCAALFLFATSGLVLSQVNEDEEDPVRLYVLGDSNGDGSVNIADPIHTLGVLFGGDVTPPTCDAALDTNGDGSLNIADPLNSLNVLFGTSQGGPNFGLCTLYTGSGPLTCEFYAFCQ